MKLLVQSAMIFFGTLMAAAVVALGEPAPAVAQSAATVARSTPASSRGGAGDLPVLRMASGHAGNAAR